jgi:hypothetical protein
MQRIYAQIVTSQLKYSRYLEGLSDRRDNPHCVATIVTSCTVLASADTPGPDGLMIRLFPEIAKTP